MTDSTHRFEPALEDLRWLRALAARLVRDEHLAEDAVQSTLMVALQRRPESESSMRAWLASILRNALRQEWRGRSRRARREAALAPAPLEPSTLEVVEELTLHRRLVDSVNALDEPYRTAIVRHYLRGEAPRDIARQLALPEKTVRTHLERGVARLRARLGKDRDAWAVLLGLRPRTAAVPLLPHLLLSMNLKALAAALGVVLVGTFLLVRAPALRADRPQSSFEGLALPKASPAPERAGLAPVAERAPLNPTSAETAGLSASEPPPAPEEILGFVRTLEGRPVPDLEILFEVGSDGAFEPAPTPRVKSGADGAFTLPLPESAGRIAIRSEAFACLVRPHLDGPPIEPPIVVVAPARAWAGQVLDGNGLPLSDARVELTLDGPSVQSRDVGDTSVHLLLPFAERVTGSTGQFHFADAGHVENLLLVVSADGFVPARLPLPEGPDTHLVIVLKPASASARTLFGQVLDEADQPVAGAVVSLGGPSVESDEDGRFVLERESWRDRGWLRAVKPGLLPATLPFEEALGVSSPERPLLLRLGHAPRVIRGRVVDPDGRPVEGASVWTPDTTPFGSVPHKQGESTFSSSTSVESFLTGRTAPWETAVEATTDAEGRFELVGLLERPYAVFVLDGRTLDGIGPIELWGGDEQARIQLPRAERAALGGRVVSRGGVPLRDLRVTLGREFDWRADEAGNADAWIGSSVRSPNASKSAARAVVTDEEGRFAFGPVVQNGLRLNVHGKAMVLGAFFALDDQPDSAALELVVDASSRFRIQLDRPEEADSFALEGPAGEVVPLFLEVAGITMSSPEAEIDGGRSGIVLVKEGEHTLLLKNGEDVVRRCRLSFPAGGLHELRP